MDKKTGLRPLVHAISVALLSQPAFASAPGEAITANSRIGLDRSPSLEQRQSSKLIVGSLESGPVLVDTAMGSLLLGFGGVCFDSAMGPYCFQPVAINAPQLLVGNVNPTAEAYLWNGQVVYWPQGISFSSKEILGPALPAPSDRVSKRRLSPNIVKTGAAP
jgi:hypothetical protein